MRNYRALLINDLHCGHQLGLTPPGWQCPENQSWQRPAWDFYSNIVKQIGYVDDLFVNGDAIDGPGYKETTEHIRTDVGVQADMALSAIKLVKYKHVHIIRGTGFHTDGHTSYEDAVAKDLNVDAVDELRVEAYGRKFHIKHVVGRSDTPYGSHTQIQKELINEILQAEFENYQAADVLIRAHVHYCYGAWTADSSRGIIRHAFTAPALQLRGPKQSSFTRKLRTWKYDFGVTLIEVDPKSKEVFIRPFLLPRENYMSREYLCLTKKLI